LITDKFLNRKIIVLSLTSRRELKSTMKKILIATICMLFFLTSIPFAGNANVTSINSDENNPPDPPVIIGPLSGNIRESYSYNVTVSDPDLDDLLIKIEINFGDGITTCGGCDGRGPWNSGDVVEFNHSWIKTGTYAITGRVLDEHGNWSEWSAPLSIIMPYSYNKAILRFLEFFILRFSTAFPILKLLLKC